MLHSHLKWIAFHNSLDERRKAIVILCGFPVDSANHRHIVVLERAARGVSEQLFGYRADENIGPAHQRFPQTCWTVELGAINQLSGGVYRLTAVRRSPSPNQIEVVE